MKKESRTLPKIGGSVHVEFKRCGRSNCRCQTGRLHGPYYYRRWRKNGRQFKVYVRRQDLAASLIGIESRREMLPSAAEMRRQCSAGTIGECS